MRSPPARARRYSKDLAGLYEVVRLWDLPGSGCVEFPLETYVR